MKLFHALFALLFAVSTCSAGELGILRSIAESGRRAGKSQSASDAKAKAGQGWDRAGDRSGDYISAPLVAEPPGGFLKKPTANLIVGNPGQEYVKSEPDTPLTHDGKAKKQKSGNQLWWTLGGAVAGAGIGFLLFGPVGAVIGALAAGAAGYFFGP
jgi:hypothetical protein